MRSNLFGLWFWLPRMDRRRFANVAFFQPVESLFVAGSHLPQLLLKLLILFLELFDSPREFRDRLLHLIDAMGTVDEVSSRMRAAIKQMKSPPR